MTSIARPLVTQSEIKKQVLKKRNSIECIIKEISVVKNNINKMKESYYPLNKKEIGITIFKVINLLLIISINKLKILEEDLI
jgi:hypothetical protein